MINASWDSQPSKLWVRSNCVGLKETMLSWLGQVWTRYENKQKLIWTNYGFPSWPLLVQLHAVLKHLEDTWLVMAGVDSITGQEGHIGWPIKQVWRAFGPRCFWTTTPLSHSKHDGSCRPATSGKSQASHPWFISYPPVLICIHVLESPWICN